jgi:hypothetical protein
MKNESIKFNFLNNIETNPVEAITDKTGKTDKDIESISSFSGGR